MWRFGLCLAVLASLPAEARTLRVEALLVDSQEGSPVALAVRLTPLSEDGVSQPPRTLTFTAPGGAEVEVPPGTGWRIDTETPGLWSAPGWIAASPTSSDPVVLRLFRTGEVSAAVTGPNAEPLPTQMELRFAPTPGRQATSQPSRSTIVCPVENGRLRCAVPSGRLDLRLRTEGRIPRYFWDIAVVPGERRDLGPVQLRRGASVVGWVQREETPVHPEGRPQVEIVPYISGSPNPPLPRELAVAGRRAEVTDRGFFQLEDLTPGIYRVIATGAGAAPAQVSPVEVRAGLEAEIREPLILAPPLTIRVLLDPPADPFGVPWKVELWSLDGGEPLGSAASLEGTWVQAGVAPGLWRLSVVDRQGSTRYSEELELRTEDAPHQVSIPVVRVEGLVTLGGEPLAATLWFGGMSGWRKIRFEADADGRFSGSLPAEGEWAVDLLNDDPFLRLAVGPVTVRVPDGARAARLELTVPDTRLRGEVVDENGRALPHASLFLVHGRGKNSQAHADERGRFDVRGLPPGPTSVEARAGERRTGWLPVLLDEAHEGPPLRLVARREARIEGRVVSARGPVSGARLWALPHGIGAASPGEAVTRPDGTFTLSLQAAASAVSLLVYGAGHTLRIAQAVVDPQTFLEIPLETTGGTLVFEVPDAGAARGALLFHGGSFVAVEQLVRWAQGPRAFRTGNALALPDLEPGDYQVCVFGEIAPGATDLPAERTCTGGSLGPLQELVLRLPEP